MARQHQDKVNIIGVAGRDNVANMRKFVERHDLGFLRHAADESGAVWANAGVRGQPTWIFIDRQGRTETLFGMIDESDLSSRFDRLAAS